MSEKIQKKVFVIHLYHRNTIQNLINEIRTSNMFINSKPKGHEVLTQEELDNIGPRLEHLHHKCLHCLAQEMGMSRDHKNCKEVTTTVHSLQPCEPSNFCDWYLQLFHSGELDPKFPLIFK